ncbi:MAG: hypothetical protein E6Q88_08480 [Lysobacteraceae bacterium]|nr:MAG: hypothetical protein E6Q88_08480 [Xanthomonadaceae bacterium]
MNGPDMDRTGELTVPTGAGAHGQAGREAANQNAQEVRFQQPARKPLNNAEVTRAMQGDLADQAQGLDPAGTDFGLA